MPRRLIAVGVFLILVGGFFLIRGIYWQHLLNKKITTIAGKIVETQINDLAAYPNMNGPTTIWFDVGFNSSEVVLDFFDVEGLPIETTEEMICSAGIYYFQFPYFGQQPSGVYFCRLTRNGQVIKLLKFVYLNGQPRNSARPEWAEFFIYYLK